LASARTYRDLANYLDWSRIKLNQVNHSWKKWKVHKKAKAFARRNDLPANRQVYGYFPITDWLFSYNKGWLRPDLIAGLTTAAVVIPKAMAYATIAGLPVQVGLYTAFVPMIILRGAWDISASQREYNHNDCDSYGKQSRQGS
jgi:hypothetical protein